MNETLKVIGKRYSCRNFTGESVSDEALEALALAAVQSPSALNLQPWRITVVKNKGFIDEISSHMMEILSKQEDKSTYERILSRGQKPLYNAPAMLFIAVEEGRELDCGIVSENIALAAASLGLGNVICGMMRIIFDSERADHYREKLIPDGFVFGVAVLVGKAVEEEGTPHVPDLSKIQYIE